MLKRVLGPGDSEDLGEQWERLIQRILAAASAELARRREEQSVLFVLSRWSRPVVASAAILMVVFGSVLAIGLREEPSNQSAGPTLARYLISDELRPAFDEETKATLAEVVWALEGEKK